ncbi:uncharacterized protein EI90DRAFT_3117215 [Cantharellus anzutake]|uniref:uncharacterized protein n=1 Tax=Cantharellus anzutake TaxID=1750568 RepID=UPI00190637A8|nr:uncharacterized protein EI90DRAFT_3117215 [Cantharellus anzutake]KAF8340706.1 hypothetical protein EI90DRAFT_3117215 [Cantharellus anzutake]
MIASHSATLFLAAAVSSLTTVFGAVVGVTELDARKPPDCVKYKAGYLAADIGGTWASFTLNSMNQISFIGDAKSPLYVEFQKCDSLKDQTGADKVDVNGRLYVPSKKKCVYILHPEHPTGPYFTSLHSCDSPIIDSFRFLIRTSQDAHGGLYWYGGTDEEGTTPQGGCGLLGYESDPSQYPSGVPSVTNDKGKQIKVTCGGYPGTPFRIAQNPHPKPKPVADCTVYKEGYLSATVLGKPKSFTLNQFNSLAYKGDGKNPLYVQFQKCKSLVDTSGTDKIDTFGRLYVPSKNQCVEISNQQSPTGPYYTTLATCPSSRPVPSSDIPYSFRWLIRNDPGVGLVDGLYWYGSTDVEGTTPQGGCGLLGYKSFTQGNPVVAHKYYSIQVTCGVYPGHPFKIEKNSH